jgi:hypothetical protein
MRLIVCGVKRPHEKNDHREFDDFRNRIVDDLAGEDFAAFWTRLAPPPLSLPAALRPLRSAESRHLLTLMSALCVT